HAKPFTAAIRDTRMQPRAHAAFAAGRKTMHTGLPVWMTAPSRCSLPVASSIRNRTTESLPSLATYIDSPDGCITKKARRLALTWKSAIGRQHPCSFIDGKGRDAVVAAIGRV